MRFDVITLFPEMFAALTASGVTRRAHEQGIWHLQCWNPRDYSSNAYRTVDDRPFGGGPGMLMMPEPLDLAVQAIKAAQAQKALQPKCIYLSPQGRPLTHAKVMALLQEPSLLLLCGRYEGVDERVLQLHAFEEISIGDYVLSGGELPAMVLLDALVRQLPGTLNDAQSAVEDSFVAGLLDCPHYTRPETYKGRRVPEVLLSGHHARIERWRMMQRLGRTEQRRPELLQQRQLTRQESGLLEEFKRSLASEQEQDATQ